jgi:hypothetical protein
MKARILAALPVGLIAAACALYGPPGAAAAGAAASPAPVAIPPATYDAVVSAADSVRDLAAGLYANVATHPDNGTVDVWIVSGPASDAVEATLTALHPGTYRFFPAEHSRSAVLGVMQTLRDRLGDFSAAGIAVRSISPTNDGRVSIAVHQGDPSAAANLAARLIGAGWTDVTVDDSETILTSLRYDDSAPWNGGDALLTGGKWLCTSGPPVHESDGTRFLVIASHCFYNGDFSAYNYYKTDAGAITGGGGHVGGLNANDPAPQDVGAGQTTTDTALINPVGGSSDLVFDCAWNCSGKITQLGGEYNDQGDVVCASGAYEGERCSISVLHTDVTWCYGDNNTECVFPIVQAHRTDGTVAAGEGDSGGPVYRYSGSNVYIRGMIDGVYQLLSCPSGTPADQSRKCGSGLLLAPIKHIASRFGTAVNTN